MKTLTIVSSSTKQRELHTEERFQGARRQDGRGLLVLKKPAKCRRGMQRGKGKQETAELDRRGGLHRDSDFLLGVLFHTQKAAKSNPKWTQEVSGVLSQHHQLC